MVRSRKASAAFRTAAFRAGVAGTAAAVAAVTAAGPALASGEAAGGGGRLQRDVDAVRAAGAPGVLARVDGTDGTRRARAGVADVRTGAPVPFDAHFRSGSNTKTYVATVMLQLVGEGRVGLDDTVDKWLPGLVRGNGNDGRRITVRHLLQHTSGLHNYTEDLPFDTAEDFEEHRFDRHTPERLVRSALAHRPDFQPGERNPDGTPKWSYSNTGYVLAGMIIKRATGHAWHREVEDRIIRPLGLRETAHPGRRTTLPRPYAHGYQQFAEGGPLVDATRMSPTWADAAGSMTTTASDHNRFFRALIGGRLLRPAQIREMRTTVPTRYDGSFTGSRYGLGLFWFPLRCDGAGYWGHGGDIPGYQTRGGVTADGGRAVTVSISAELEGKASDDVDRTQADVVQNALCAG
ncbi:MULTISPECIES: serine hydrolase domain-containing protein [Actinomadura]|uniref:Serine hydrolase domain-containing protein n=1 Tax=Actinomadura yumaensis TaxID=111807 RepID=A0ABW2CQM0_9ACTN|nr:serine hydrolase domain-containing protein [Actinomadura sp. J1-007]